MNASESTAISKLTRFSSAFNSSGGKSPLELKKWNSENPEHAKEESKSTHKALFDNHLNIDLAFLHSDALVIQADKKSKDKAKTGDQLIPVSTLDPEESFKQITDEMKDKELTVLKSHLNA